MPLRRGGAVSAPGVNAIHIYSSGAVPGADNPSGGTEAAATAGNGGYRGAIVSLPAGPGQHHGE